MAEMGDCFAVCRQLENEGIPITPDVLAMRLAAADAFYSESDFVLMANSSRSAAVAFEAMSKIKARALKTFLKAQVADIAINDKRSGAQMLDSLKAVVARADKEYRTHENNFVTLQEIVPKLDAIYDDLHKKSQLRIPNPNN